MFYWVFHDWLCQMLQKNQETLIQLSPLSNVCIDLSVSNVRDVYYELYESKTIWCVECYYDQYTYSEVYSL